MTAAPPPATSGRAFFEPGGFSRFAGAVVPPRQRLLRLTGVFLRGLLRGWLARLGAAAFLLPAVGIAVYVLVRSKVEAFAVPVDQQAAFLLDNLGLLFTLNLGWLLLGTAATVAPLVARDAWHGALLLYFSRPVERSHYLLARLLAVALTGTVVLAVPGLLLLLVHATTLGLELGGTPMQGWLAGVFWLGAATAVVLASVAAAVVVGLVALCAGAIVRNPATAPLLFGGGVLGSIAVSWVLQLAWGRESAARALDLHHALQMLVTVLLAPLQPGVLPRPVWVQAGVGLALWLGLALLAWFGLQRFVADPPLGRSRAG